MREMFKVSIEFANKKNLLFEADEIKWEDNNRSILALINHENYEKILIPMQNVNITHVKNISTLM